MATVDNQDYLLVDGSGYLFRAFYAMPALTNADGLPTGAIYGVINMLMKLNKTFPQAKKCVVFDSKGKTHRHDWYPDYKANRGEMPEDLAMQIPEIQPLIQLMGWPLLACPGIEADDIIGTLAKQAEAKGHRVCICSADKDFAQLVSKNITIYDGNKDVFLDQEAVKAKFGVWPEQIIDYLTLVGDSVDNIPGVEKVGPKTAVKWLDHYQTLDQLCKQSEAIQGKIGERLRQALPRLPLYKKLVTIQCDLSLPESIAFAKSLIEPTNKVFLGQTFQRLGFKTWYQQLSAEVDQVKKSIPVQSVDDVDSLKTMQSHLLNSKGDLAWIGVNLANDDRLESLQAMAIACEDQCFYIRFDQYQDLLNSFNRQTVFKALSELWSQPRDWCVQSGKLFYKCFNETSVVFNGRVFDVGLMAYIHRGPGRLALDQLSYDYLQRLVTTRADVFGTGAKQQTVFEVEPETIKGLLAQEVEVILALKQTFLAAWQDGPNKTLYETVDGPLMKVLADMESRGVTLNLHLLAEQSFEVAEQIKALESKLLDLVGHSVNLASPKQCQALLYEELGLPVLEKTPKGQPSTGESALQQLAESHQVPGLILEHRGLSKLKSTYLDALPKLVSEQTQRLHANFQQVITSTGRLSCQDPNLQNIPIRSELGKKIRHAFVASPGYELLCLDYSQIELRIMAHISKDENLLAAFHRGEDVHASTAAELYQLPVDKVTSEQRRFAKIINFGLIYGMSAFGLAKQLQISRSDAQGLIDTYFERYPGVSAFMEVTRSQAMERGFVETLLGRKIHLPDIKHGQQSIRRAQERAAINAPMQGTAAEIIKLAMLKTNELIQKQVEPGLVYALIQVHDELVFEVKKEAMQTLKPLIQEAMESALILSIPLLVNAESGHNWGLIH